jgi:ABC-type polysaccharide/polyol phosphate transport system ATPase subunit
LSDELHGIVLPVMDLEPQEDAVTVAGVHKWYRVYASPTDRLRRVFGRPSRHLDFQALDDVSFSVTPGSALGVIGENGAGKTTLLKLIAGTTKPTAGRVEVRGIVAAILELGAAFHPEFSGRDNAILYGALMGLDRAQMERRLDDILAFAELGEFIDHPVKSYSTGMAMRLGFAVATHVDPDVLVVDEALAVGDGYFQKKCVDRIRQIRDRGTTILFCSHSMYYVTMFCERALWLAQGRVERIGPAHEVVEAYESFLQNRDKRRVEAGDRSLERSQSAKVGRVAAIHLPGRQGDGPIVLEPGGPLEVEIEVESSRLDERYHVGVAMAAVSSACRPRGTAANRWSGTSATACA